MLKTSGQATTAKSSSGRKFIPEFSLIWLAALLLLVLAHQFPASYSMDPAKATELGDIYKFHSVERTPTGELYRWSKPESYLRLLSLDTAMRVRLNVDNALPPDKAARPVKLGLVGSSKTQEYILQSGLHSYDFDIGRGSAFLPSAFTMVRGDDIVEWVWLNPTLKLTTDIYQPSGDRRELGVVIKSVEVIAGPAYGSFGFPTLQEVLLTTLLALFPYFLVRSISKRFRLWALLASVLPVLVWTGAIGIARVEVARNLDLITFGLLVTCSGLLAVRVLAPRFIPDFRNVFRSGPAIKLAGLTNSLPRWFYGGLLVALLVPVGLNLFSFVLPETSDTDFSHGWALDRFRYLPVWLAVALALIALLSTFPPLNNRLAIWLGNVRWPRFRLAWVLALAAFGALVVFALLRTSRSYGDENELISKLQLFIKFRDETGNDNFLIWREREPLDFALHFLLWRIILGFSWWEPRFTYVIPSILAGTVFVVVLILLVRQLVPAGPSRWLVATLTLSCGTMLVFCGYIESYTFVTLVALIYILLAVYALKEKCSPVWAGLALGIEIMLHPQSIFLGPSFVILLLWRAGLNQKFYRWRQLWLEGISSLIVMAGAFSCMLLLFAIYRYDWLQWGISQHQLGGSDDGMFRHLLSVPPGFKEQYPLLSLDYLRYEFNLLLQVAPVGAPLLILLAVYYFRSIRLSLINLLLAGGILIFFLGLVLEGKRPIIPVVVIGVALQFGWLWLRRANLNDPVGWLLGTAALYTAIFGASWNADMGFYDWDLLSLQGLFISLFAGYLLVKILGSKKALLTRASIAVTACSFSLQAGWLLFNAFFRAG